MPGKLVLVGTPIGNLSDFSPRARQALEECDFIAAEDTRVTLKLLNHFSIKKPLVSYYEHNRREKGALICQRLEAGETACLVTDAGMPAISDPGEDLVALCAARGIPVAAVPGPSAVFTALALSGLPTGRFCFEGFLSTAKASRRDHLNAVKEERRTLVFYEAPHKLPSTLQDLYDALGDRRVAICREMTKLHEEVIRTTLGEAAQRFRTELPRGEQVLVVEGAPAPAPRTLSLSDAAALAKERMAQGMAATQAAKEAARESGLKKGDIYRELMQTNQIQTDFGKKE